MAGGRQGVERAIELLAEETRVAMMLMGAASVADLRREGRVRAPWL
jgi:L-lactate dehydrogenase (cytochrome)